MLNFCTLLDSNYVSRGLAMLESLQRQTQDFHLYIVPFDEQCRAVLEALTRWVLPHRKLVMLARHFDEMPRKHARFVEWRRTYAHVMECKALEDDENAELPCLLLAPPVVCVRLFDPLRYRGGVSHESGDMIRNRELFDAVSQRSVESFPASVLGL